MFGWFQALLNSQYKDLTEEMAEFDERLIVAEQRLNELDGRLRRSEERVGIPHHEGAVK